MQRRNAVAGHPLFNVLETGLLVRIPRIELGTEFGLDVLDCDNLPGVVGGHRGPAQALAQNFVAQSRSFRVECGRKDFALYLR